jgi:ABC-type multidrug transport system permease subunit
MSWLGIYLGLLVPSVEVAQQAIFTVLFPITFLSNVFVPPQTLPSWLQPIAEWNPLSATTAACRELFGNPNPMPANSSWPMDHPIEASLLSSIVMLAIFMPLALHRYKTIASR